MYVPGSSPVKENFPSASLEAAVLGGGPVITAPPVGARISERFPFLIGSPVPASISLPSRLASFFSASSREAAVSRAGAEAGSRARERRATNKGRNYTSENTLNCIEIRGGIKKKAVPLV